MIASYYRSRI